MALAIYLETHVAACSWAHLLLYYVFGELNYLQPDETKNAN